MKPFSFIIFIVTISTVSFCQSRTLIISTEGIDSLKIGMEHHAVEKIVGAKLRRYVPDSLLTKFSALFPPPSSLISYFECDYKGLKLILVFFGYSRLDIISPILSSGIVETNTGIKVGMCKSEFLDICTRTKTYKSFLINKDACFFSDGNEQKFNSLFAIFTNSLVTAIGVKRMAGD
jgi:hypothetical protein